MAFVTPEIISQILDRCDIVQLISSYIPLRPAGVNLKSPCPFHDEKTPSFVVSPEKQIFRCFGCGVGGNAISFVMHQERIGFVEAINLLADKLGISIPNVGNAHSFSSQIKQQLLKINELAVEYFHHNLLMDRSSVTSMAREYLRNRGLSLEVVKKFRLGFSLDKWDGIISYLKKNGIDFALMEKVGLIIPQNQGGGYYDRFRNRLMFPIFDVGNRCLGFGARTLQSENTAKYINSPETVIYTKGHHLYGLALAKEAIVQQDCVIVVEGYLDFITTFLAGVSHVVASLGTALTIEQIRLLRRYTNNVIMLFDNDEAGEAAMVRSLDILIEEGMNVRVATLSDGEDPDSFIRKMGKEEFLEHVNSSESIFNYKLTVLKKKYDEKTIEGSTEISMEMLQTISKFRNTVTRVEYVKKLARTLMISEEAILVELKKMDQGVKHSFSRRKETVVGENNVVREMTYNLRPVERNILRLMLEDKEFVSLSKESLPVSDFQSPCARYMVEKIYDFLGKEEHYNLAALMGSFDDQRMVEFLSSLVMGEDSSYGDRKKIYHDCVFRLKEDRLRSQRQVIRQQMIQANESGDAQKLQELTQEFNQLVKIKG